MEHLKYKQQNKNKQGRLHKQTNKELCTAKDTSNRMKRHPMEWEKIFSSPLSDKRLISKNIKNSCDSTARKIKKIPLKKSAKQLNI